MIKKFILIFFITLCKVSTAQLKQPTPQNNELIEEKIYVHFNSNLLLTGETLYYSIYCLNNNNLSPFSKIAYFELINSDNKSIIKHRIALNSGIGYGDLFINTKIKTGTYKIIAYTQWMKNKRSIFFKNIYIVNPFSNKLKHTTNDYTHNQTNNSLTNDNTKQTILFSNLKPSYSKRENIRLTLTDNFLKLKGNFSISIRRKNNFILSENTITSLPKKADTTYYLPELRGAIIHGKVTTLNNINSLSNIKLSLSLKNRNELPVTATTNKYGEFYFNISYRNTDKIYIQVLEKNPNNYKVKLIKQPKEFFKFDNFPTLHLNKDLTKLLKNRSIYSQIENAFFKAKKDSIYRKKEKTLLLNNLLTIYKLDDYKRFKTIKETFTEIIKGASFIRYKNQHKINVTSTGASKSVKHLPSLLVIDGHIVNNHNILINFDSRKIDSISIVKNKYFYGNALYQGIVLIKTFQNDFLPELNNFQEFKITPIQPEKKYFFQNEKNVMNKRIPDFRTQLFWNPNISLTKKNISFFTSDVTGHFEITLQGYTKKGEFINIEQSFSVK